MKLSNVRKRDSGKATLIYSRQELYVGIAGDFMGLRCGTLIRNTAAISGNIIKHTAANIEQQRI